MVNTYNFYIQEFKASIKQQGDFEASLNCMRLCLKKSKMGNEESSGSKTFAMQA